MINGKHNIEVICAGNGSIRVGQVIDKEFVGGSVDVTNGVMRAVTDLLGDGGTRIVRRADMPDYEISVRRIGAPK